MSTNNIRQGFKHSLARDLLDDIQLQQSNYYCFLGKIDVWGDPTDPENVDVPPDSLINSFYNDRNIRGGMAFVKKIMPYDTTLAIRKIEWDGNNPFQYDFWDNTKDMTDADFYTVNSLNQVFKCLDNNAVWDPETQSYSVPNLSTVEPIGETLDTITTSDGYIWKYMYTISPYASAKFLSSDYIPVKRAMSDTFYNSGEIASVGVTTGGSGYDSGITTEIVVTDNSFTGSGASVTGLTVDAFGSITGVAGLVGGSLYTKGVRLSVDTLTGTGAQLEAVISEAGEIVGIEIISAGIGYEETDTVIFDADVIAVLVPVLDSTGSIVKVIIEDGGIGYTSTPTLTVSETIGSPAGAGKYEGNSTALLTAVVDRGSVVGVLIVDPGVNYSSDYNTTVTAVGAGTGALFVPVISSDGEILEIITENGGSNYTEDTTLEITHTGLGTGAVAVAGLRPSDIDTLQAVVEQTAIAGAIYKIVISNRGFGYAYGETTVTIEGDGTGATAELLESDFLDQGISHITITNPGSGYTYANVVINYSGENPIVGDDIATAYAVLPPPNGHGKDATTELLAKTIAISSNLRSDEGIYNLILQQEYRTFGIMKNLTYRSSGRKVTLQSSVLSFNVVFDTTTSLQEDMILFSTDNHKYQVLDIDGNNVQLLALNRQIVPSGNLSTEDELLQFSVQSVSTTYDVNKYSGSLLYCSLEEPFEFSDTQSVTIKTFITF